MKIKNLGLGVIGLFVLTIIIALGYKLFDGVAFVTRNIGINGIEFVLSGTLKAFVGVLVLLFVLWTLDGIGWTLGGIIKKVTDIRQNTRRGVRR